MDCADVRSELVARRRGWLPPALADAASAHLATCDACRRADAAEADLDALLAAKLPRRPAPPALRSRLEALVETGLLPEVTATPRREPPRRSPRRRFAVPALVAALAVAAVTVALIGERGARAERQLDVLTQEAVNDHLRALVSEHPLDLVSSSTHQLKPWFEGRLDFAPVVPAPAVADLRLDGGSVGYVLDRKAAVIAYHLRRHAVTLLAFDARGVGWPGGEGGPGGAAVRTTSSRGFQVALWRSGEIGYALVSDVAGGELRALAERFAAHAPD